MSHDLLLLDNQNDIELCFPVFKELRPHLDIKQFVEQVIRQQKQSYQIVAAKSDNQFAGVAGFRITEFLAWGKVLYIDDLVTLPDFRGRGCASAIMQWLIDYGTKQGCAQLHLDSGHHRHSAHKFYLNQGLKISSHHFSCILKESDN